MIEKSPCSNQWSEIMTIPRAEYPRPQFARPDWLCLNGEWQFEIDGGDSGLERGLLKRPLSDTITVPFCPESELSGLGYTDFLLAVWYKKMVTVPSGWKGRHVLLHFGCAKISPAATRSASCCGPETTGGPRSRAASSLRATRPTTACIPGRQESGRQCGWSRFPRPR